MIFQVGDRVRTSTERLLRLGDGWQSVEGDIVYPAEMTDLFDRDATVTKVHGPGELATNRVYRLDISGGAWYFDEMALELIEEAASFDGWEELI